MNIPDWLKPVTLGFMIGAVAASSIGFSWATGQPAELRQRWRMRCHMTK